MHGIELKSGINNCHWNMKGRCTNPKVTHNEIIRGYSRDWDSKQNCTLTIENVGWAAFTFNPVTCSMGELFGPWIPDEWIEKIFESVRANPQWTFLFLTKYPERLPTLTWPVNAWIGATIDRQERVEAVTGAFTELFYRRLYNNKLFISCEPLLEKIVLPEQLWNILDWFIVGALSRGKEKVQPEIEWIESLFNRARFYNVPIWFKDNLIFRPQEVPCG